MIDECQITMEQWSEMIEQSMGQDEHIWEQAKNSKIVNLSTTFMALERSHAAVQRVLGPFSLLVDGGDEQASQIHEKFAGKLAQARVRQLSDPKFAARCQEALDRLGNQWPAYQVRAARMWLMEMWLTGSLLKNDQARERLGQIAARSAELESQFQQMNSKSCDGIMIFEEKQLEGVDLSKLQRLDTEEGARWGVKMIREPVDLVLENCTVRATRKKVMEAFEARGNPNDIKGASTDKIIEELLALRSERAQILGFENYAELKLIQTMAGTPQAAKQLLTQTWNAIDPGVKETMGKIQALAREDGIEQIRPWDTAFYARKIRPR